MERNRYLAYPSLSLAKTCEDQVATRVNAHPPRLFVYDIMICSAKIREVGNHTLREQEIASCDQSKTSDI